MAKICSVDGCSNRHQAKGFCDKHYKKWRRHANPLAIADRQVTNEKISKALTGREFSNRHRDNLSKKATGRSSPRKGIPASDAQRIKQHNKMKGRPSGFKGKKQPESAKKILREKATGRKDSEETKKRKKESHNTSEAKEKSRLAALEVQSRPGVKEKQRKSLRITYGTPEGREMQRQRRYDMTSSPESQDERLVQEFLAKNNIEFQIHPVISLPKPKRRHQPDILVKPNKIIAVNGDRYHANPMFKSPDDIITGIRGGSVRAGDLQKEDELIWKMLKNLGYDILVLWEYEFGSRHKPKITKDIERKIFDFLEL
jgi:G:T-mismatch repair DNA endonuclease (very short patch repair protein)